MGKGGLHQSWLKERGKVERVDGWKDICPGGRGEGLCIVCGLGGGFSQLTGDGESKCVGMVCEEAFEQC